MKRSKAVHLVLLASSAAVLEGCRLRQCLDRNGNIVNDGYCQTADAGTYGYHYVGGYSGWGTHSGSGHSGGASSRTGTVRGVFGGAGASAHAGGSHGSGGHGGGGE